MYSSMSAEVTSIGVPWEGLSYEHVAHGHEYQGTLMVQKVITV